MLSLWLAEGPCHACPTESSIWSTHKRCTWGIVFDFGRLRISLLCISVKRAGRRQKHVRIHLYMHAFMLAFCMKAQTYAQKRLHLESIFGPYSVACNTFSSCRMVLHPLHTGVTWHVLDSASGVSRGAATVTYMLGLLTIACALSGQGIPREVTIARCPSKPW